MTLSVIVPIYNGQSTIRDTLKCLQKQNILINQLILINDKSSDNSLEIIKKFKSKYKGKENSRIKIINNKENKGLATSYNIGFFETNSELVAIVHQDVIFDKNQIAKLIMPFNNSSVVATTHHVIHPYKVWKEYSFWQKALFSRLLGKEFVGIDGKFDCFRRSAIKKVGYFDQNSFKSAGEDGDITKKLLKIGKITDSRAKIVHLHESDKMFSLKKYIFKHAQYAQAQGALLRKYGTTSPINFIKAFFREILLIGLLIPFINKLSMLMIAIYSIAYTYPLFTKTDFDIRKIVLPFVNIYLLFVSFINSTKGFILKKEVI